MNANVYMNESDQFLNDPFQPDAGNYFQNPQNNKNAQYQSIYFSLAQTYL